MDAIIAILLLHVVYRESDSSGSRQGSRLPSSVSGETMEYVDGLYRRSGGSDSYTTEGCRL